MREEEIAMERGEGKVLDGVDGGGQTVLEDEAWVPAEFVHEPPVLEVTQPKGSFCQIDARFSVALDPDGVYNIITDPNNRRVFKNIKVKFPLQFLLILAIISGFHSTFKGGFSIDERFHH